MAYYSTHGISKFLLNNEKERVRFLLARPVHTKLIISVKPIKTFNNLKERSSIEVIDKNKTQYIQIITVIHN